VELGEHILGITRSETVSFLPVLMLAIIFACLATTRSSRVPDP